jgi:hypothetical protein
MMAAPAPTSAALLTLDEVCRQLACTRRQVRRLATGADPLPVLYLNRKQPRVRGADLEAWLTRRLTGSIDKRYSPFHDWRGVAAAAEGRGLHAGDPRGAPLHDQEPPGRAGARQGGRPRSGGVGRDARLPVCRAPNGKGDPTP